MSKEFCVEVPQQSTENIVNLQSIADSIHNCHKSATKAKIVGTLIQIPGRILSFVGLFTSLFPPNEMLTTMGVVVGFVGGAICLIATASDHFNQFCKQENVEEIVRSYQEMRIKQADKLIRFNQAVQAFNQIKLKNIPDKTIFDMFCVLLDFLNMFVTILILRKLTVTLAVFTIWWNISSIMKGKELGKKIEIIQKIQQIAENMEDKRFHFKKAYSKYMDY